jgi:multiple sugar transport system permease protein
MKIQRKKILTYFLAIIASLYSIAPFSWLILTSLKTEREIYSIPPIYIPSKITFIHYVNAFTLRPFTRYIINSTIVSLFTMITCLLVGSLSSYPLARYNFYGKKFILLFLLSFAMFPPIVMVGPLFEIFSKYNLMNNTFALVWPYTSLQLPFTIYVLTTFFKQIPKELEDSARIDGARELTILFKIIMPLAAPALASTGILIFIFSWNEFLLAVSFLTADETRTVPVGISLLSGKDPYSFPWGEICAATIVTSLPLVIVALLFQKQIIQGLTAGAIKA